MLVINNKTDLDYETIGNIIDQFLTTDIGTIYYDKMCYFNAKKKKHIYRITVHFGKNRTKFVVEEVKD